jgi:serine/threonine protein kinase
MVKDQYYGLRHDVWGLGILSFFLFSGRFPFDEDSDEENKKRILEKDPDWTLLHNRNLDDRIIRLLQGMLEKDPGKRLTIKQVMANKLFQFMEKTESKVKLI